MPARDTIDAEAIRRTDRWLQRLARGLVRNDADADDVRQETWHSALKSHARRPGSSLNQLSRRWLARIASNLVRKEYRASCRRRRREEKVSRPERDRRQVQPHDAMEAVELRRQVFEAVSSLKEPYRSTIVLRFFEDLSLKDVAASQGLPLGTVKARVSRGLSQLRERLDGIYARRKSWAILLAPRLPGGSRAGRSGASAARSGATATTILKQSGLAMSLKAIVSAGCLSVALVVALGVGWRDGLFEFSSDGGRFAPGPRTQTARLPDRSVKPPAARLAGSRGLSPPERQASAAQEAPRPEEEENLTGAEPGSSRQPVEALASAETIAMRRAYGDLKSSFGEGGGQGWKNVGENIGPLQDLLLSSDDGFEEVLALIDEESDAAFLEALMHHMPLARTEWRQAILEDRELHDELWARFEEEDAPERRMAFLRFFAFNRQLNAARMGAFLETAIDDPAEVVRQLSIDAIASNRELIGETWQTLARVFENDPSLECRRTAIYGLAQVGNERATALVNQAFASADESLRAAALHSDAGRELPVSLTGGDSLTYLVGEFRAAESRRYKKVLVDRLTELSPDVSEQEIRRALPGEKDWSVKKDYRSALERIAEGRKARAGR